MAILIKATEEKKILISGTEIELLEVYGRIRFLGDFSGTSIEGEVATFANKATFLEGKMLYTDVPIGSYKSDLEPTETQSLDTAHKYAKLAYEQMGYEVIIDMTV
jgi:predicted ATPase